MTALLTKLNLLLIVKYLSVCIILTLGILNPASQLDAFISYFILGSVLIYLTNFLFKNEDVKATFNREIIYFIFILTAVVSLLLIHKLQPDFFSYASISLTFGFVSFFLL